MDPNATLKELLEVVERIEKEFFTEGEAICVNDLGTLIEGVVNLDEWLSKGGFLPDRWNKGR